MKTQYIPKGSMCGGCTKAKEDCSDLDFESMPIISIELDAIIVRCTEYQRKTLTKEQINFQRWAD